MLIEAQGGSEKVKEAQREAHRSSRGLESWIQLRAVHCQNVLEGIHFIPHTSKKR